VTQNFKEYLTEDSTDVPVNEGDILPTLQAMDSDDYRELRDAYFNFMDGYWALKGLSKSMKDKDIKSEIKKLLKSPEGNDQLGDHL
jgi:hypothetical protein